MGKSKRSKKKADKKRNEEMDKINGGIKQKAYKHHKEKDTIKTNQNKFMIDKSNKESEKFKKLCSHEQLKGAILDDDITFTKFDFDKSISKKDENKINESNRNEHLYNVALNMQSNSTTKYQVYKKEKKSAQDNADKGYKTLEKDVEYDFKTFIPQ